MIKATGKVPGRPESGAEEIGIDLAAIAKGRESGPEMLKGTKRNAIQV